MYGTNAAATVGNNMLRTFTELRFGLMVGIGGGIPNLEKEIDIRLGDVVVSQPDKTHGGVVQHDLGKNLGKNMFERQGFSKPPPTLLLTALSNLQSKHDLDGSRVPKLLVEAIKRRRNLAKSGYGYPGLGRDILHCSHTETSMFDHGCTRCEDGIVRRGYRDDQSPVVHYGVIASGNELIKHSAERDRLGDEFSAKYVEMEAAALMNEFPCLVTRDICDYADSHKNDAWQKYAASTAAAFAKELLSVIKPIAVDAAMKATETMNHRTHALLSEGNQLQKEVIQEHRRQFENVEVRNQTEHKQRCHQDFKTSPYEQYKNVNPDKIRGTCHWVIDNERFQAWHQSNHDDLLWISADPGCGKSVLAKSLIDHNFSDTNLYSVCYFFFKDNERQDNLSSALCAILHQLFSHQPALLVHALAAWNKSGNKIQQEIEEMWRIFLTAAASELARPIVCVLDALDECRDEDRRQILTKLCNFYQRSTQIRSGATLKFLITSRPYDSVQRWFEQITSHLPQTRLRGEDENDKIHDEINLVIAQRVHDLAVEFRLSAYNHETLRQRLERMEHRTYLWLHLAQDEVRKTYRDSIYPDEVQIKSLPISVEDAYERILSKIEEQQSGDARKMLLIIVGMRRAPTVAEMALALGASRAYAREQSFIDAIDLKRLEQQIRESCGLFVFINYSQLFLIHQTAKEFLVTRSTNLGSEIDRWKSSLPQIEIEIEMASLCVTYLYLRGQVRTPDHKRQKHDHGVNSRGPESESRTLNYYESFYEYCAEHWTLHLEDETVIKDEKLLSKVMSLYTVTSDQFQTWFPIMWISIHLYRVSPPKVQTQHVVAKSNHSFVLNEIFHTTKFDLEARDSTNRTALHWAIERDHSAVVSWLCQSGADVNARGNYDQSALDLASEQGSEQMVRILLDAGADVNAEKGSYRKTALQFASAKGHQQVVRMLLDAGADVNAKTGAYYDQTALQFASARGHEHVVRMLWDAGADVNTRTGEYYDESALQVASIEGHEQVVRMLLDAGADVNAGTGEYYDQTALQLASAKGHEQIVRMLLNAGADVNARGLTRETALRLAIAVGCEKVVQMLIDAGADVLTT